MLQVIDLEKKYNGKTILDKVNLRLEKGQIKALVGPNGSGKTTLMNLSLIHISEPTRREWLSRMPSSA